MKIYLLAFFLFQFNLIYSQTNYDFKLNKSIEVDLKKSICLNTNNYLFFKTDRRQFYLIMHHSNSVHIRKSQMIVDTVDNTPYKSRVHIFNSIVNKEEFIVLWETEFESLSYITAYYLTGKQLIKIGELKISLSCPTCEYFGYPIKSISIRKVNNDIDFSFLEDLGYWVKGDEEKFFKAGAFKYLYNVNQKKLKVVTTGD